MTVLLDNSFVTSVPTAGTSFITLFITVFPQIRLSRSSSPSIHLSSVLVKDTVPFMERARTFTAHTAPQSTSLSCWRICTSLSYFQLILMDSLSNKPLFYLGHVLLQGKCQFIYYLVKIVPSQPSSHSNGSFKLQQLYTINITTYSFSSILIPRGSHEKTYDCEGLNERLMTVKVYDCKDLQKMLMIMKVYKKGS